MIGVILWSDPEDRKAVIWCEDQGDLAFLNSPENALQSDDFFDAGDVVQFDMALDHSIRRASNPKLVVERAAKTLPDALRNSSQNMSAIDSADVIPFVRPERKRSDDSASASLVSGG